MRYSGKGRTRRWRRRLAYRMLRSASCARLRVPKPLRGYWARLQAGQIPRRPPLAAFREEIAREHRDLAQGRAAGSLSNLQQHFYQAALADLQSRGVDVPGTELRGKQAPRIETRNRRADPPDHPKSGAPMGEGRKGGGDLGTSRTQQPPGTCRKAAAIGAVTAPMLETEHKKDRYSSQGPLSSSASHHPSKSELELLSESYVIKNSCMWSCRSWRPIMPGRPTTFSHRNHTYSSTARCAFRRPRSGWNTRARLGETMILPYGRRRAGFCRERSCLSTTCPNARSFYLRLGRSR